MTNQPKHPSGPLGDVVGTPTGYIEDRYKWFRQLCLRVANFHPESKEVCYQALSRTRVIPSNVAVEAASLLDDAMIQLRSMSSELAEANRKLAAREGWILMPNELTAENGAKAALIGEFSEKYERGNGWVTHVDVSWTTIKEIYKAAVKHFHPDTARPHEAAPQKQIDSKNGT